MKGKTVFYIFIGFSLTVFLGIYLSESATNELLGVAAQPQFMALMPERDGTWLVKFLGWSWLLDPAAILAKSIDFLGKAQHSIRDYWVRVVMR